MKPYFVSEVLRIGVDYRISLDSMVAAGNYDWQNNNINDANFPLDPAFLQKGFTPLDIELICFGRFTYLEEVLGELELSGRRAGLLPELLAIGATFPQKQIEFPIVEVGSVWPDLERGGKRGVYLRRGKKERGLSFIWLEHGFPQYYRIIAAKKPH